MTKQYMVRIYQNGDDWADVVVDAADEEEAKKTALAIVIANPDDWFDVPKPPTYSVDKTSDVEELDGGEYQSATMPVINTPAPESHMVAQLTDELAVSLIFHCLIAVRGQPFIDTQISEVLESCREIWSDIKPLVLEGRVSPPPQTREEG